MPHGRAFPLLGSYTDNSGSEVYIFQPPKSSSAYPCVIFNNGSASDRKITQKISYSPGKNYVSGSANVPYGSVTTHAYQTSISEKAASGVPYAGSDNSTEEYDSTKYIFIVNNGTKNVRTPVTDSSSRYKLDEMHVVFYSDAEGQNVIGTDRTGYIPDKLLYSSYEGSDVYRIAIPDGACYFSINNGQAKGSISSYTNYRESEVKQLSINGLYRFVQKADDYSKYWNSSSGASSANELDDHYYYFDLINYRPDDQEDDEEEYETASEDVHLARVETGDNGLIKKIIWLKPAACFEGEDPQTTVNADYLDYTVSDIDNTDVTEVRVKKWGTYFWKEVESPSGYLTDKEKLPEFSVGADQAEMAVYITNAADTPKPGQVLLTKTAKEKAGHTEIGGTIAGVEFRLVKINEDGTENHNILLAKKKDNGDTFVSNYYFIPESLLDINKIIQTNEFIMDEGTLKVYNTINNTLMTDADGRLRIENLSWGSYYLEEVGTPDASGYSIKDADNNNNRVYFTVGRNNCEMLQQLSCSDYMEPAYIRLYEHIDQKRTEWGDPTFIFRIRQTHIYNEDGQLEAVTSDPKVIICALTVNDDGTLSEKSLSGYKSWLVESTDEKTGEAPALVNEYEGLFNIDDQGRIRLEPGKYEISRVPVSRYEFVTSADAVYDTDSQPGASRYIMIRESSLKQ